MVYFDINLGRYGDAKPLGRILIELKADVTPKTAENFRQLCLMPPGEGYAASRFHRVIPEFMCQGGDFTNDNGTGAPPHASPHVLALRCVRKGKADNSTARCRGAVHLRGPLRGREL